MVLSKVEKVMENHNKIKEITFISRFYYYLGSSYDNQKISKYV